MYLRRVEDEKDTPKNTIEKLIEINLDPEDSEKKVLVGAQLTSKERERIVECLRKNNRMPKKK